MKDFVNKHKVLISVLVILFLLASTLVGKYNSFVAQDQWVQVAWSQVENQYQRRADLIPSLVATAQQFASEERQTFENVINARSAANSVTVNVDDLEWIQEFAAKQGELTQALSKLMLLTEAYPDLNSAPLFQDLMTQLEWTENRISTERGRYNELAWSFNALIKKFPNNFISSMFGVSTKSLFQATEGSNEAPDVSNLFWNSDESKDSEQ